MRLTLVGTRPFQKNCSRCGHPTIFRHDGLDWRHFELGHGAPPHACPVGPRYSNPSHGLFGNTRK